MAINPEFYRATEKDQAYHHQPGQPETAQWWYHSAIFDNGYSFCVEWWVINETNARIFCLICDPNGRRTLLPMHFHFPSEVSFSKETLDITMGNNRYHGRFPTYEMHFSKGDTGADLTFECLTQPIREPPDGVWIGRASAPPTPRYISYVIRPRCRVTGKLTVAGKEMFVSSEEGYADHQWGNGSNLNHFHSWYWGGLNIPNHTFIWWDGVLNEGFGYQPAKCLWVHTGETLSKYSKNPNIYVVPSDLSICDVTGVVRPRKVTLIIDEDDIKGTVAYTLKHVLITPADMMAWRPISLRQPPRYFRSLSEVHYHLDIEGKELDGDGEHIHESAI